MALMTRVDGHKTVPTVKDFFVDPDSGSAETFSLIVVHIGADTFASVFTLAHGMVLGGISNLDALSLQLAQGLRNALTIARVGGLDSAEDIRQYDGKPVKYIWVR